MRSFEQLLVIVISAELGPCFSFDAPTPNSSRFQPLVLQTTAGSVGNAKNVTSENRKCFEPTKKMESEFTERSTDFVTWVVRCLVSTVRTYSVWPNSASCNNST